MKTPFFLLQRFVMRLDKFNGGETVIAEIKEIRVSTARAGAQRSAHGAALNKRFQLPGGRAHGEMAQTPSNLM